MGGLGGGGTVSQNSATAKDESEVSSSSVPTSVDPSQPSAEEAAVVVAEVEVGEKEQEGADGVKKEVDKVEKEEMVEPTKTGGSV